MNFLNTYRCLDKQRYASEKYSIVPLQKEDIFSIRIWRNDQMEYLRQSKPITEKDQIDYYENVIRKTFNEIKPDQILFSFLLNEKCIGYGGLVHIDWNSRNAEISFLTETNRAKNDIQYSEDFYNFLKLIFIIAFEEIQFNRLETENYEVDSLSIKILENLDFKLHQRLRNHVLINGKYFDSLIHICFRKDYKLKPKI